MQITCKLENPNIWDNSDLLMNANFNVQNLNLLTT